MEDEESSLLKQKNSLDWDEGIFIVLAILITFVPVVFYPYCIPPFEPAKMFLFQSLVLVAFTLFTLKMIYLQSLVWVKKCLNMPILIFLIYGSLSLVWSINIHHTLLGLPQFLAGPILYYVVTNSIQNQKTIDRLLFLVIAMGTLMGAYGILQYLGIDFEFWTGNIARKKVFGLFGNVNYFAEYLVLPLSLAVGIFLSRQSKYHRFLCFLSVMIMGLALFLTFTRGSYLAIAASIPIMLFFYLISHHNKSEKKYYKNIVIYFLLIIMIALAIIYLPTPLNQGSSPLARLKSRVSLETLVSGNSILRRIATWKFTWMMIKDYFLLGSGLGTYDYHTLKYQADFFALDNNREIYPHGFAVQAHNEYLQLWSELGLIGLLLFLWILFCFYRVVSLNLRRDNGEKQKAITIGLTGGISALLVDSIFGFPLQLTASFFLFWLFIGLVNAQLKVNLAIQKEEVGNIVLQKNAADNDQFDQQSMGIKIKKIGLSLLVIVLMVLCILLCFRPLMSRVYYYYGNQQIVKKNYNEAINIYEKGLKWNPWQGEMYYDIANIMFSKGINQLALEYYLKAEQYVDHHNLPKNIASIYMRREEPESAIPYLEKAIRYQPDKEGMLPLQLQLGNLYLSIKDFRNAEQLFAKIIKMNPENANAYYGIAGVYVNQGRKEETIETLQKVIELAPESKIADYARVMLKKFESSKQEIEQQEVKD